MSKAGNIIKTAFSQTVVSYGKNKARQKAGSVFWALSPIEKALWFIHPKRAVYAFILQKSLRITWSMAKKYMKM